MDKVTFEVYEDNGQRWRWRAKCGNGQIIACSGESFASESNAERAADSMAARMHTNDQLVEVVKVAG